MEKFRFRKIVAAIVVFAMFLSVVGTLTPIVKADEEPNNDFEHAETITAGSHVGSLDAATDTDDYYSITVSAGQTLSVKVTPSSALSVWIRLYDEDRIEKVNTGYGDLGETIECNWTTNSAQANYLYYVCVSVAEAGGSGTYIMDISLIPQNDAGSGGDAGDTLVKATNISTGTSSGFLKDDDVYDCYKTVQNVTMGQGIYIKVTPVSTLSIEVWLYDKDQVEIDHAAGGIAVIVRVSDSQAPKTGIYYIKVGIAESGGKGTYSMLVSIEPTIDTPTQDPPATNVQPNQDVTVSVNVTSTQNTVSTVTLYYRNDSTWISVSMTLNEITGSWDGQIPGFPYCTEVSYKIKAYNDKGDYFEETKAGEYYTYHVIPEFPNVLILPLFMLATLLAVVLYRRKQLL